MMIRGYRAFCLARIRAADAAGRRWRTEISWILREGWFLRLRCWIGESAARDYSFSRILTRAGNSLPVELIPVEGLWVAEFREEEVEIFSGAGMSGLRWSNCGMLHVVYYFLLTRGGSDNWWENFQETVRNDFRSLLLIIVIRCDQPSRFFQFIKPKSLKGSYM